MAKTETLETTTELANIFDPNSFEAVLAEYGITADAVHVATPQTVGKANFEMLCDLKDSVVDSYGNPVEHIGTSGPLMFLEKKGETDADDFAGYDGFYIYALLHPKRGQVVVTLGRPEGEGKPAVPAFLDTLQPGALFQVAMISTRSGFKTFVPVPVQPSSNGA